IALTNWPPIDYQNNLGEHTGISADILELAASRVGLKTEPQFGAWDDMLAKLEKGQIDLAPEIYYTEDRAKMLAYSRPFLPLYNAIFVNAKTPGIASPTNLNGKVVAVEKGYALEGVLKSEYPHISPLVVSSTLEALKMVSVGQVDAYIGSQYVASHIIDENLLHNVKAVAHFGDTPQYLHMAVPKDRAILRDILDKALGSITDNEKRTIIGRYIPVSVSSLTSIPTANKIDITDEEMAWLKDHPVIRVANDSEWPPFDFFENGTTKGYSMDYMRLLAEIIGIRLEFVQDASWDKLIERFENRDLDLITAYEDSPDHRKYAHFTEPFLETFESIIIRKDTPFLKDYRDLYGKKIAVIRGYDFEEEIRNHHPQIDMVLVDSPLDGLRKVQYGEAEALLENSAVAAYLIEKHAFTNLMLAGNPSLPGLELGDKIAIAIRKDWPELHALFSKAMKVLTESQKLTLQRRWLGAATKSPQLLIELSDSERAFLKANPVIRVSNETNWPPLDFAVEGRPQGYMIDLLNLLAERIGIRLEYVTSDSWSELQKMFRQGELDMLQSINKTPEREAWGLFSVPLYQYKNFFIIKKSATDINSIADLSGKRVAVPKGWSYEEYLTTNHPEIEILTTTDSLAAFQAVINGEADATIESSPVTNYLFSKNFIADLKLSGWFKAFDSNTSRKLHLMTHRHQPELLSLFNKAMASMTPGEIEALQSQWMGDDKDEANAIELTDQEREWISNHPVVNYSEVNWQPMSIIEEGRMTGLMGDYLDIIAEQTGLKFNFVPAESWPDGLKLFQEEQIDIIPGIGSAEKEAAIGLASRPYANFPLVIVGRDDASFVNGPDDLEGMTLAIPKGLSSHNFIKENYPSLEVRDTENIKQALSLVSSGEADAFIGHKVVAIYNIESLYLRNLKIIGLADFMFEHSVLVQKRDPILVAIINKVVDNISTKRKKQIYDEWVNFEIEQSVDYTRFYQIAAVVVLLVLVIIYWNRQLQRAVAQKTAELREVLESLEIRVEERTQELVESEGRIRGVMENVADGIVTITPDGYIESVNREAEAIFGYQAAEMIGQKVNMLIPPAIAADHDQYLLRYMQTREPQIIGKGHRELTGRHRDGHEFPMELSVGEVKTGDLHLFVGATRDISSRKEAERQIAES
ncbi:MAG: transporter substrate-binding domain-containing protein, partial [Gammaproteobacteria bacterium]|nr:transporter substrate-binding domain-containing protein [Gammaproteobacteria bacterium]